MADRLTQLQDAVNQMADHFCNSVGVLQQSAQTSSFPATDKNSTTTKPDATPNEDYARLFSKLIARTAKDVDVLIDSLPSEESSAELQVASLKRLEEENQQAAKKLESIVSMGESLLGTVQESLHDIANSQLKSKALECGDT